MEIVSVLNGAVLEIALSGCLDATTSPKLEEEINAKIADVSQLVLNFEKLEYLSSAGLRVLLNAQKLMDEKKGSLVVRHVCVNISEIFSMTGFDEILKIEA